MARPAKNKMICIRCKKGYWKSSKLIYPGYCSLTCHHIDTDYKVNCEICKKAFRPRQTNMKHCSPGCSDLAKGKWFEDYQEQNKAIRFEIFKRDDFKCCYCGKSAHDGHELTIDHIYPREYGGNNDVFNLTTSCVQCNSKKNSNPLTEAQTLELWERNKTKDIKSGLFASYAELKEKFDRIYIIRGNVVRKAS